MKMRLLRVTANAGRGRGTSNSGICAGACVYSLGDGRYAWGEVAPVLKWFRDKSVEDIGRWLRGPAARKGWRYEWVKVKDTR